MKKYILGLIFLSLSMLGFSQAVKVNTAVSGASFTAPNYVYFGGTSADTLYASDTLIWSVFVKGADVQSMDMRLYIDKVTGTVSDTVYFYESFDGVTKDRAIDSIFNSNVSDGYKYINRTRWTDFKGPYILVWNWDKAGTRTSVKSVRKLEVISRNK